MLQWVQKGLYLRIPFLFPKFEFPLFPEFVLELAYRVVASFWDWKDQWLIFFWVSTWRTKEWTLLIGGIGSDIRIWLRIVLKISLSLIKNLIAQALAIMWIIQGFHYSTRTLWEWIIDEQLIPKTLELCKVINCC